MLPANHTDYMQQRSSPWQSIDCQRSNAMQASNDNKLYTQSTGGLCIISCHSHNLTSLLATYVNQPLISCTGGGGGGGGAQTLNWQYLASIVHELKF